MVIIPIYTLCTFALVILTYMNSNVVLRIVKLMLIGIMIVWTLLNDDGVLFFSWSCEGVDHG